MPVHVRSLGQAPLELSAVQELIRSNLGFTAQPNQSSNLGEVVLGTSPEVRGSFPQLHIPAGLSSEGYWLTHLTVHGSSVVVVDGADDRGVLYGAFALIGRLRQGELIYPVDLVEQPAMPIRWVDEWDNANGTVERGYGGRSIFFEGGKVRDDLSAVGEYARLLASVGINGCNVNNVNGAAPFLAPEMIKGLARIADAMRPWGVRLAISVDIASPQKIGGLKTFDPLDPAGESVVGRKGQRDLRSSFPISPASR